MDFEESNAERVRRYAEAQTVRGLIRIAVWVPSERANEIRQTAARLRCEAGMLLPREATAPGPSTSRPTPFPPGPNISLDLLLELMSAARDEPPEQTLKEICTGRGPLGIAAALARIADRLGYKLNYRRDPVAELAELRDQWIGIRSMAPVPAPTPKSPPAAPKASRNGLCPCGSGKKYKRCCADLDRS